MPRPLTLAKPVFAAPPPPPPHTAPLPRSSRDLVGFYCGLASLACWIVAQLPQLITNYRLQRADALSPFFLAEWLLGDTCNLVGALLKGDQPETVVITAQYFICMDCVLLLQYIYYTAAVQRRERTYALQAARRRRHHHHHHHGHHGHGHGQARQQQEQQEPAAERGGGGGGGEIEEGGASNSGGGSGGRKGRHGARTKTAAGLATAAVAAMGAVTLLQGPAAAALRGAAHAPSLNRSLSQSIVSAADLSAHASSSLPAAAAAAGVADGAPQWKDTAGSTLAYVSCVLYLTSRVSQIIKNASRHSAEGLASSMFMCAVAANSFFGASVLLRSRTREETLSSLPWVLGSLGTVVLDLVILAQTGFMGRRWKRGGGGGTDEEEPLLEGGSAGA